MRNWLRRTLPDGALDGLRRLRAAGRAASDPYARTCYSQEGEDVVLQRMFEHHAAGFYVDVGAHHPQRFSNTYLFYKQGWRGINIEPNPSAVALFQSVRPRDINLALGISGQEGVLTYFMFNEPALNTFSEHQAALMAGVGEYRMVDKMHVPVKRLDAVLQAHLPAGQIIDVLSVDVEGFDLEVLMSNDWQRYRPRCVVAEAYGLSFATLSQSPVDVFLTGQGYELYAKTANSLMYLDRERGAELSPCL